MGLPAALHLSELVHNVLILVSSMRLDYSTVPFDKVSSVSPVFLDLYKLHRAISRPVVHFYRAMHFSAKRGIAIACRLSVCLSVCPSVRL